MIHGYNNNIEENENIPLMIHDNIENDGQDYFFNLDEEVLENNNSVANPQKYLNQSLSNDSLHVNHSHINDTSTNRRNQENPYLQKVIFENHRYSNNSNHGSEEINSHTVENGKQQGQYNDNQAFNLKMIVDSVNEEVTTALGDRADLNKFMISEKFFTAVYKERNFTKNFKKTMTEISKPIDNRPSSLATLVIKMSGIGFSVKNISSMLHGIKRNITLFIDKLDDNIFAIKEIKQQTHFTNKNIASTIHGAGKKTNSTIQKLKDNKDTLRIIKEDHRFSEKKFSNVFSGKGKNIETVIQAYKDFIKNLPGTNN